MLAGMIIWFVIGFILGACFSYGVGYVLLKAESDAGELKEQDWD